MIDGDAQLTEVIGLIPAAGLATRISPLSGSKELFPVGFRSVTGNDDSRPKVIAHYLLEKMRFSGISKAYIVLRKGKWDIPSYFGDGAMLDMHLAYLIMNLPFGAPYTVDQAYPYVKDAVIALGFPDIFFEDKDAFSRLLSRQAESKADVVLGIFPGDQPSKMDMVELDDNNQVSRIEIKPVETILRYTWGIAVWTPNFTKFMHDFLIRHYSANKEANEGATSAMHELFLGNVIQAAIENGLRVEAVKISDTPFIDIGTPDNLMKIIQHFALKGMEGPTQG